MTFIQRLYRVRCWFRGYHVRSSLHQFPFRYDCPGVCYDCGTVGSGISGDGE